MKLFLDTANLSDIEEALKGGFVRGVTTNPSLLAKEPKGNYIVHLKKIVYLLTKYGGDYSLSVEVFSNDAPEMIRQAEQFASSLNYKRLAVKIPISFKQENYLAVVKNLSDKGIIVNCTACMTPMQLMMAAASGAKYISLFYNRARDGAKEEVYNKERKKMLEDKIIEPDDFDPNRVLRETRLLLDDYPETEIIAGSIRTPTDVKQAGLNGAHIVTASLQILKKALGHFKTDHAVKQFLDDFSAWIK